MTTTHMTDDELLAHADPIANPDRTLDELKALDAAIGLRLSVRANELIDRYGISIDEAIDTVHENQRWANVCLRIEMEIHVAESEAAHAEFLRSFVG